MKHNISEDDFINLVMKYHDDSLTDEENTKFNEILKSSPEHVVLFNDINLQITQIVNYAPFPAEKRETHAPKVITIEKNRLGKLVALVALIAISLVASAIIMKGQKKPVITEAPKSFPAEVIFADKDLEWEGDVELGAGENVEKGWYKLLSGQIKLKFSSGAEMEIDGPAYFAVVSAMESYLEYGHVSVYAPESARNFTIKAPTMDVIDLGTKFSLNINQADGESKVNVTEGLVNLHLKSPEESQKVQLLSAGAQADLSSSGQLLKVDGEERKSPTLLGHWTFDDLDGFRVPDSSGNLLHGRLVGREEGLISNGVSGKSFDLSGDQYVDLSSHIHRFKLKHFSISTWVKNPVNMVFSMSDGTRYNRLQFERYKNRVLYGWQKGKFFDSINGIVSWEKDEWYHLCVTYSSGHTTLYRNGQKLNHDSRGRLSTNIIGPMSLKNITRAHIGVLYKGSPSKAFPDSIQKLKGEIDDFQIYSATLSDEEVEYLFKNPGSTLR